MKACSGVFLDYEAADLRRRDSILAAGFGGFAEIALGLIRGKLVIRRHENRLPPDIFLPVPMARLQSIGHRRRGDHAASPLFQPSTPDLSSRACPATALRVP